MHSCQKFPSQHNNKVFNKSLIIGGEKPGLRKTIDLWDYYVRYA